MSAIIKTIIAILMAIIIASILMYAYEVPIQKVVLIGFLVMMIVIIIVGLIYAVNQNPINNKNHDMKPSKVLEKISDIWIDLMGAGNTITLYSGGLESIIWDDDKKYWAGTFDGTGGLYNGSPIVLIYCADEDNLCYINPTPSPNIINNPFYKFEPKKYSMLVRSKIKNDNRRNKNTPFVNVDLSNKPDKKQEENKEFDKIVEK